MAGNDRLAMKRKQVGGIADLCEEAWANMTSKPAAFVQSWEERRGDFHNNELKDDNDDGKTSPTKDYTEFGEKGSVLVPRSIGGSGDLFCQADGCETPLQDKTMGGRARLKLCSEHLKAEIVNVEGVASRFCTQCSRTHPLDRFEGALRSCKTRRERRRQRQRFLQQQKQSRSEALSSATGELSTPTATGLSSEGLARIFSAGLAARRRPSLEKEADISERAASSSWWPQPLRQFIGDTFNFPENQAARYDGDGKSTPRSARTTESPFLETSPAHPDYDLPALRSAPPPYRSREWVTSRGHEYPRRPLSSEFAPRFAEQRRTGKQSPLALFSNADDRATASFSSGKTQSRQDDTESGDFYNHRRWSTRSLPLTRGELHQLTGTLPTRPPRSVAAYEEPVLKSRDVRADDITPPISCTSWKLGADDLKFIDEAHAYVNEGGDERERSFPSAAHDSHFEDDWHANDESGGREGWTMHRPREQIDNTWWPTDDVVWPVGITMDGPRSC